MEPQRTPTKVRWGLIGFGVGGLLLGASALVLGLIAIGVLVVPFVVWLAWNVLDFAAAIGAPELGFWGIILMTLFLTTGFGGRIIITLGVWLIDPTWFAGAAELKWPQPSVRTFTALVLLLAVAQIPAHTRRAPHASDRSHKRRDKLIEPDLTPRQPTPV